MAVWKLKERNDLVRANEVIDVAPVCIWGGGATPSTINVIDQVNPVTTGDATDFGDLDAARQYMGGMGNKIKGIFGGGDFAVNVIQSTAIFATGGNSSDFGNLTVGRLGSTAVGNDTRILFAGGDSAPNYYNTIDQVSFATTGNATDFGDLQANESFCAGASSTTRGIVLGGNAGADAPSADGPEATTHLITLATLGNATDFGEMATAKNQNTACSNNVKGVVTNGQATLANGSYEQFNIATTGSFTNFGQLTAGRFFERGAGSQIAQRGLFGGGANPSNTNVIDFCSFTSGSTFSDFGDLSAAKKSAEGLSNNAGGIGGSYPDLVQRPSVTQDGTHMPGSGRAFAVGGQLSDNSGTVDIDTYNIQTLGNTRNFGDLIRTASNGIGAGSSRTRAVCLSGYYFTSPYYSDMIQSFEMASEGNATDFGNAVQERYGLGYGAVGNTTRGVFMGGYAPGSPYIVNDIDFLTFATMGNATDFGDLTNVKQSPAQASNNTRGLSQGGTAPAQLDIIDYVTIASAGNATDFGDSTVGRSNCAGAASSVRAVQAGGGTPSVSNVIDYVTIASTGDATDFGDLTQAGKAPSPSSDATRAVFGGRHTPSKQTTMDFITIATTGNASDFGDLKEAASEKGGISDSHAGLQG